MAQNHLKIRIEAEGGDAKRVLGEVRGQLESLGSSAEEAGTRTKRAGGMISSALTDIASHAGLVASLGATFVMLSQKSEEWARTLYQTRQIFGQTAGQIIEKSQEMAEAVDHVFSATEIQYAFGKIHDSLERYGLDIEKQTRIIERAMDIAAARGLNLRESIDRIESAMRGEAEASEYLGLTLNDTYMQNQALDGSLKNLWTTLSDGEKAQYRYLEFLRQSAKYAGAAKEATETLGQTWKSTWNAIWDETGPILAKLNEEIASLVKNLTIATVQGGQHLFVNTFGGEPVITRDQKEHPLLAASLVAKYWDRFGLSKVFPLTGKGGSQGANDISAVFAQADDLVMQLGERAMDLNQKRVQQARITATQILNIDKWLETQRIALIQDSTARRIAIARAEEKKMVQLAKGNSKLIAQIHEITQKRIAQIREQAHQKEQEAWQEEREAIKQAYEAAMAFIQVHEQTDTVAMQIERLKQEYSRLEEAIWSAFEAGVIGADEAWQAMDRLTSAQQNDTQRILSSHKKSAKGVSEAWKNAYNQVTNFLEDWLSGSRSLVQSFLDWIRHALAQVAATSIVGSIAGGLGLPGAAAWAGTGGIGGAAGFSSIGGAISAAGGVWNWINGGLSSFGNTLMYGVPEKLLDWGFTDAAFTLGSLPPELMGGLTAGIGTFLLNGLLTGDWAKAAVSGASTGIGAGIGSIIAPGIGTAIGALVGGIGGNLLGGLFGDGTERTYLRRKYTYSYDQDLGASYTYRTTRWDRGTPDWMDTLVDTEDKLARSIQETLTSVITTLDKFSPGFAEKMSGRSFEYQTYWGVEDKKEFEKRYVQNVVGFSREIIGPVIEEFKTDFKGELSGLDLSLFTDDAKKQIYGTFDKAFAQIDFSHIKSIDDLKEQFSRLNAVLTKEKQLEEYVAKIKELDEAYKVSIGQVDKYHHALSRLNEKWADQQKELEAMGVDLAKMPEFFDAWHKDIENLKKEIIGWAIDVPDTINENWRKAFKDLSQVDLGGKLVELINGALDDPSKLSGIGESWANFISDSFKSSVLSQAMSGLVDQVKSAYINPLVEQFIGQAFNADTISSAFSQMDELMPKLAMAGDSIAEIFNYIEQNGNLAGFDWKSWQDKYQGVWDEINQRNQEASKQMESAAQAHEKAASSASEAASRLQQAAGALTAAAGRIQQPPPVYLNVSVAAPEANLG